MLKAYRFRIFSEKFCFCNEVGVHFISSNTDMLNNLLSILVSISMRSPYRPRFVTQMSTLTSKSEPETKKASTEISRSNWETKKKSMTYKRFVPIASGSLLT